MHAGAVEAPIDRDEWAQARADYYSELDWDEDTGAPSETTLERVGLTAYRGLLPNET